MATSLQRQLAALANPSSSLAYPERKVSSLLFTPQEAAKHKREVFYQIGLDGLDELIKLDSKTFHKFQSCNLFNEVSKNFERIMEEMGSNQKLDNLIEEFLIAVSPYLMLKASLKCIEWLINRFHIEKFNIGAIMQSVLPYYDTKTFGLLIGILEVQKRDKEWQWIIPNVKTALPLCKADIFAHGNPSFIIWMFTTLNKFMKVHEDKPDNLRTFISFMTTAICGSLGIINQRLETVVKRGEQKLHSKTQAIVHCLWSQLAKFTDDIAFKPKLKGSEEIHSLIYIVSAMLFHTTKARPELTRGVHLCTRKVMKKILKNHPRSLKTQAYLLLNMLSSDRGNHITLRKKILLRRVLNEISILSSDWDLWHLSSKLILRHCGKKEFEYTPSKLWNTVKSMELTVSQRSEMLRSIYDLLQASGTYLRLRKWKKNFLVRFEREYPTEFDMACELDPIFASGLAKATKDKNLLLLSQHPHVPTRKEGVMRLLKKFKLRYLASAAPEIEVLAKAKPKWKKGSIGSITLKRKSPQVPRKLKTVIPDTNRTAEALLPRFKDDSIEVVHLLIKQNLKVLLKMFSAKSLVVQLVEVIRRENCSMKCKKIALVQLCKVAEEFGPAEEDLMTKVFIALIPFLFPTKESTLRLSLTVFATSFAFKNPLLGPYAKFANRSNVSTKEICDLSYDIITSSSIVLCETWTVGSSSELSAVFAALTLNSSLALGEYMEHIQKLNCRVIGTNCFPITKDSFPSCICFASKKQILSLELVLTKILKLDLQSVEDIERVIRFVFYLCESVENRNICAKFLDAFLKKSFPSEKRQVSFWVAMIINATRNHGRHDVGISSPGEFTIIRCLQCLYYFLKECADIKDVPSPHRKYSVGATDSNDISGFLEVILTNCISSESSHIRLWGVKCLEVYSELEMEDSTDGKFVRHLLDYRDEILADSEQIALITSKAFEEDEFACTKQRFVHSIVEGGVDDFISIGLLRMLRFAGSDVFSKLSEMAKELLRTDPNSKKLLAILNCFNGILDSLSFEILVEALKHNASCTVILSKITPKVFDFYDITTKKKLIALLIDVVLFSKIPEVKVVIQRRVRKWMLDGQLISSELEKCITMEKLVSSGGNTVVGRRGSRKAPEQNTVFHEVGWTNRSEVVLEFVQTKKHLKHKAKLISPLFKLLKICMLLEEQAPVEYVKQLILTTLTLCCYDDEGTEIQEESNEWIHFNVETVIDCLRCSRNPQTHHHALILLNYAAKKFPEQVLHGIMSLFTFMGNSVLRQDDTYSTQLIQQTVTTIIPTLSTTTSVRQFSKYLVSAGIFRVFACAVQDIPVHRRLPVFRSLVETMEPVQCMWQVCVIIVDNALTRDKKRSHLNADLELATELVWNFETNAVLATVEKVYKYLTNLPIFDRNITPEAFKRLSASQDPHSKAVIDLSHKETLRDVEIVVLFTIELVGKICGKFNEMEGRQELNYEALLEHCLWLSRLIANNQENKIFRLIGQRNYEVIERVNAALEPKDFIRVSKALFERDDVSVRKKMLDLLNQRILHQFDWFKNQALLLDLIPSLVQLAKNHPETDEQVTLVQTTFLSLKLIAKHLVISYPDNFVSVFELASNHIKHRNRLLRASALLCVGELFSLKALILSNLTTVCSAIIKSFKASIKLNSTALELFQDEHVEQDEKLIHDGETSVATANLLCISTMTCLNKLIDQLGTFLGSSFLQKALVTAFSIDGIFGQGLKSENRKKIFEQRLKTMLKTFGSKIPLRNSFVILKEVFTKLEEVDDANRKSKSLGLLIGLLKETLLITPKVEFNALLPSLCDGFLEEFLLHREKNLLSGGDAIIETSILDCLVSGVILKMSEGMFRPFYHKMFDWASESLSRLITFYKLSGMAAERLKSLFVTFAGFVINEAPKQLSQDPVLTKAILLYLYQIFLQDREGFISIDRFNALVKPLVDLVESEYVLAGEVTIKLLNDTLIQLAVASNDLNRWQHMIDLLSLKTRHSNPKVRLYVISTIEAAATELGKDFLPLLPPAVPFLAEMLNDDDENVEKETKKVLLKLEELLGEPLQPYFTV